MPQNKDTAQDIPDLLNLIEPLLPNQISLNKMQNIEYLTSKDGKAIAVVIPIDIWRQILPNEDASLEELAEGIEDYCLNKAMNEAVNTPLIDRSTALAYLEE